MKATIDIASKIRKIRSFKGYSQEYMAMVLEISQSQYQRMESGEYDFKLSRLEDICKHLDIDLESLLVNDKQFIVQHCTNGVGKAHSVNNCSGLSKIEELYERLLAEKEAKIIELSEKKRV